MRHFIVGRIPFKRFEISFIERVHDMETWSYKIEMFNHYFHGVIDLKDSEDLIESIFKKIKEEIDDMLKAVDPHKRDS